MKTKCFLEKDLSKAATLIQEGEIVAFPTDTVYGLGADAQNEEAVAKIFKAKERPINRALTVLIAEKNDLKKYTKEVPNEAQLLVDAFWPGPLTIVLKKKDVFAPSVTANLETIGLRMPDHPLTLRFIKKCGVPLAAPSANSSGHLSPTTAEHVLKDLKGQIPAIIDGGETPFGIESTILDLSNPMLPTLLRPGGITRKQIEAVIGKSVSVVQSSNKSKGTEEKHYEPAVPLYIVKSNWEKTIQKMNHKKERIGLLASDEIIEKYGKQVAEVYSLGRKNNVEAANKKLFKALRFLEESSATVILAEDTEDRGFGEAFINRLEKAANGKTI